MSYLAPNDRVTREESEFESKFSGPKPQPPFTPLSSLLKGSRTLHEREVSRDTFHQRVLSGRPRAMCVPLGEPLVDESYIPKRGLLAKQGAS